MQTDYNKWLDVIRQNAGERLNHHYGPLLHMWGAEEGLGLNSRPVSSPIVQAPESVYVEPQFKTVTGECLTYLRFCLFAGEETELVGVWAEKIMRYCEVWKSEIKTRAFSRWPSSDNPVLQMLQLTAFLLDYYFHSLDLRYLNTVLKLADMKWLVDPSRVEDDLRSGDDATFVSGLFQVRILFLRERALKKLEESIAQ